MNAYAEILRALSAGQQQRDPERREREPPRFQNTFCSQCGAEFGPGNHGFSHCENHQHLRRIG